MVSALPFCSFSSSSSSPLQRQRALFLLWCCLCLVVGVNANSCSLAIASASIRTQRYSRSSYYHVGRTYSSNTYVEPLSLKRSRRKRRSLTSTRTATIHDDSYTNGRGFSHRAAASSDGILLASAAAARKQSRNSDHNEAHASTAATKSQVEEQELESSPITTYEDLSLAGKIIAGVVELVLVTAFDYMGGFCQAYFVGSLWGIPGLFRPNQAASAAAAAAVAPNTWKAVASQRLSPWHQRSMRWGKSYGTISAAVTGFRVATRLVRGGVEDEWTSLISSMAMGAYFSRKEGAMAMVRGALLYGVLVKVLSTGSKQKRPAAYEDKEVHQF